MRKNGSRLISVNQYKSTDLFIFAVIIIIFDLMAHYAPMLFTDEIPYSFCLTVPITLVIMIRWGWCSVFFAVGDALLLTVINNPSSWQSYICYGVGNASLLLLLIVVKLVGKKRIASTWYFTSLFVLGGWVLQNLMITVMNAICGYSFVSYLASNFGFGITGVLSLAMGLVITLVLRRLDGMYEDQIEYLKRLKGERDAAQRLAERGEDPIELDEESLAILNKDNDLY